MPKVLARDPAWLARPSPGFELFNSAATSSTRPAPGASAEGPRRQIAHRGTEVFVAVGTQITWGELGLLKDAGEAADHGHEAPPAYRVLKTPVSRSITQLSISPSGDWLAILTSHTCHVAVLPSASHLRSGDATPLKLRTFQVGPTAHVLEQAPLVAARWHPLSPYGGSLVTVASDACVRLFELDRDNRSSFDEPSLAVDLKKLANATSAQADFSASKYGTNQGFSPDSAEMQVASACFGGRGGDDEHGWASMTLWVAMSEGDVYALCPFLPSKWVAPASLLPSLSTSVVAKVRAIAHDRDATEGERRTADQQYKWLTAVDGQEPMQTTGVHEFDPREVYSRPDKPGAVPKLQGPFYVGSETDIGEITDIYVIPPKIDDEALFDEAEDLGSKDGLSVGVVCIATSTSKVHVCLDLDGVEAEWLPYRKARRFTPDSDEEEKDLLLFETIDLSHADFDQEGWPTFTASPTDRYEVFATTPSGVYNLDFNMWTSLLEDELAHGSESGLDFRLDVLLESAVTAVSKPIELATAPKGGINTAITILDATLGYMVLTSASNVPYCAQLDLPTFTDPYAPDSALSVGTLPAPEPRAPYQPAEEFFAPSQLPHLIKTANDKKLLGSDLKSQKVRFSTATLQLITDAHRILSSETHRLGFAAADLFRRCERMRAELQEQVRRVHEIAQKVDTIVGEDEEPERYEGDESRDGEMLVGRDKIEYRLNKSHEKTVELNERVDRLQKKMMRLGGKELSAKEKAFQEEVRRVRAELEPDESGDAPTTPAALVHLDNSPSQQHERKSDDPSGTLAARFAAVSQLREQLVQRAHDAAEHLKKEGAQEHRRTRGAGGVGGEYRKKQLARVMSLLERETALVEGVTERLARLSAGV